MRLLKLGQMINLFTILRPTGLWEFWPCLHSHPWRIKELLPPIPRALKWNSRAHTRRGTLRVVGFLPSLQMYVDIWFAKTAQHTVLRLHFLFTGWRRNFHPHAVCTPDFFTMTPNPPILTIVKFPGTELRCEQAILKASLKS